MVSFRIRGEDDLGQTAYRANSRRGRVGTRRRQTVSSVETLEDRTLLNFTPIAQPGNDLPDGTVYTAGTTNMKASFPKDGTYVNGISDGTETVSFSDTLEADTVPSTFSRDFPNWNSPPATESDTPRILEDYEDDTSLTLTLSKPATVFGFELEIADPGPFPVTATFMEGTTTVGSIPLTLSGQPGAMLFAASTNQAFTSVAISYPDDRSGFAIAQVRYALTPSLTGVTETPTQGATPVNFYAAGGSASQPLSGDNATPWTINITFNGPISPGTINANTVNLVDLGNNPSQPLDQPINLSGKLSYVSATNTLVISLAASGLTLGTDAYQITLFGSGSTVLTNPQGVALSGVNTVGGTSTGAQLALPSGNGYPGGNFFDSFIINTTPPAVLPGSFKMDPASDTNIVGDNITMSGLPTFDGTVSEANPGLVPLVGQTAIVDIGIEIVVNGVSTVFFSTTSAPSNLFQFIRPNAGTALTTAGGAFAVTVGVDGAATGLVTDTSALPDLTGTYNVGLDGKLSPLPGDDSGYYVARARIIDQSGNRSSPTDPNAQVPFVVDTTPPTATFTSPTSGQVITSLNNGVLSFTFTTNKNIDLTHFNASSIVVTSAGPDGILGTADDVNIPVDPNSIGVVYLDKGTGGSGAEQISFSTLPSTSLTNDLYSVTLLNTGTDAVRDIAGNLLASPVTETFKVFVALTGATVPNITAVEGMDTGTIVLATFTDSDPLATSSEVAASVPVGGWGDGTPSMPVSLALQQIGVTPSTSPTSGQPIFDVLGSHTYAEETLKPLTFTIDLTTLGGVSTTLTSPPGGGVTVLDAPLFGQNVNTITGTAGISTVLGPIASFLDANTDATSANFTTLSGSTEVFWGDGSSTALSAANYTASNSANGVVFSIDAAHTYAGEGQYTISINVTDEGGQTTSISSTASIATFHNAILAFVPITNGYVPPTAAMDTLAGMSTHTATTHKATTTHKAKPAVTVSHRAQKTRAHDAALQAMIAETMSRRLHQ